MPFEYTIFHVPGKLLYIADTLSRTPQECLVRDAELANLTEEQMTTTTTNQFPTTTDSLESYQGRPNMYSTDYILPKNGQIKQVCQRS